MVDEAVLDVSDFAQRHPGGRRLILNTVGTDVTQELLGDQSVGNGMSFSPHVHTGVSTDVGLETVAPATSFWRPLPLTVRSQDFSRSRRFVGGVLSSTPRRGTQNESACLLILDSTVDSNTKALLRNNSV